jgi:hypothetical protein
MSDHAAAMRGLPRWHPNPFVRSTIETIRRHGWEVTAVGETSADCPFAYTAGLGLHDIPELAVYGLDPLTSADVLNELGKLLHRHDWHAIVDGGVDVHVKALTAPVRLIEIVDKDDLLMANLLFPDTPALQVTWPDQHGRHPWEPGCTLAPRDQELKGVVIDGAARIRGPRVIRAGDDAA